MLVPFEQPALLAASPFAARMRIDQQLIGVQVLAGGAIGDQSSVELGGLVVPGLRCEQLGAGAQEPLAKLTIFAGESPQDAVGELRKFFRGACALRVPDD